MTDIRTIISKIMLWSVWSQTYASMVEKAVAEWMT